MTKEEITKNERESIIAQLVFVTGRNKSAFEMYTDDQLIKKMKEMYA